jgi:hypothetical protein
MGAFFLGPSKCSIRDDASKYSGPSHCLTPADSESKITQCVNTVKNNSIHTGKAILSTIPSDGISAHEWQKKLIDDFSINASVGTSGAGDEKGLASLLQFLKDNEAGENPTKFFRSGSLRVIIFLSDEDDQSQILPPTSTPGFGPHTGYSSNCSPKTVDGYTYTLSDCPDSSTLMPVSEIKTKVDQFFSSIDGDSASNPNYLVASIVATTGDTIRTLQEKQITMQKEVGLRQTIDQDLGSRYIEFANSVGNGSMVIDIGAEDYGPILRQIGRKIVVKSKTKVQVKAYSQIRSFELEHNPDPSTPAILMVEHADGGQQALSPNQYTITGTHVTITDEEFLQTIRPTDTLVVKYRPSGAY